MKLIDTATGKTVAEITTNHSMTIDEILSLMRFDVDNENGELFDRDNNRLMGVFYEDLSTKED